MTTMTLTIDGKDTLPPTTITSRQTIKHLVRAFARKYPTYSFSMTPHRGLIYLLAFNDEDEINRLTFRVSVPNTSPEAWADLVTDITEELV